MAWTYNPELSDERDQVRLLTGDTLASDPQLSDEEIDALLLIYSGTRSTAIAILRMLAAKYARFADKWVGDLKILASQKHEAYLRMAESLSSSGASSLSGVPSAGGIYTDQKQAQEENSSLATPAFRRGVHDNEEE